MISEKCGTCKEETPPLLLNNEGNCQKCAAIKSASIRQETRDDLERIN